MTDDHSIKSHMEQSIEFCEKIRELMDKEDLCAHVYLMSMHAVAGGFIGYLYGEEKEGSYRNFIEIFMNAIKSNKKIQFRIHPEELS